MRVTALVVLIAGLTCLTSFTIFTGSAAETVLQIVPPTGATFAPGQRFDIRIEATDLSGEPKDFSISVNGRDVSREVFSAEKWSTFPLLDNAGMPTSRIGGGVTRRDWSFKEPGRYQLSATLVDSGGVLTTATSVIQVLPTSSDGRKAKNIILFIGDGLGVTQRTAARIVGRGIEDGRALGLLEMDTLDTYGFSMTSSLDALVTDSSPAAAALATGNKSINNSHGVYPDNTGPNSGAGTQFVGRGGVPNTNADQARLLTDNPRVENIAELLRRTRGMTTGVVTTVGVTDSTPASFSSHSFSRYAQANIAEQLIASGHSVILGAGTRFFVPAGDPLLKNINTGRGDTRNLVDEAKKSGFTFVSDATELQKAAAPQKLFGLFHPADMTGRLDRMRARAGNASGKEAVGMFPDQPDLEVMTRSAIEVLAKNRDGFFLMVEGGSIDREYHRMDPYRAVIDTLELDKAIGVARDWARRNGNDTLIVVTGDHETSGLALTGVLENGRGSSRSFPGYKDDDHDGFPDDLTPALSLAFDFASTFRPSADNHYYDLPRNLGDLNPTSTLAQRGGGAAGHTAVDLFVGAAGPESNLFGKVMDNTELFFNMLRAVGYK